MTSSTNRKKIDKLTTIKDIIDGFSTENLDLIALSIKSGDTYIDTSYGELRRDVNDMGSALIRMGLNHGDKIGILSENRTEWIITYLAAASVGLVIVPMDIFMGIEDLKPLVENIDIKVFFTSYTFIKKIVKLQDLLNSQKQIVCFDIHKKIVNEILPGDNADCDLSLIQKKLKTIEQKEVKKKTLFKKQKLIYFYSLLTTGSYYNKSKETPLSKRKVKSEDTLALIYMGKKTFATLTHHGIIENLNAVNDHADMGMYDQPETVLLATLPLHHTFPLMSQIFMPLSCYFKIVILTTFKLSEIISTINEIRANIVPTVPLILEQIYDQVNRNNLTFKSLRHFICGGAPVRKNIITGFQKIGADVMQGYGLSEYSPVVSVNTPMANRAGSVGRPMPKVQVKLVNTDTDGNGELLVKGPSMMSGYYNDEEKTRSVVDSKGWLYTGDIARLDNDGFLYITGRIKKIIVNKGGKNIHSEEIENILRQSPLISDVKVIPKIDDKMGEYPHAIIFPDYQAIKNSASLDANAESATKILKLIHNEINKLTKDRASYRAPGNIEISEYKSINELPELPERFMFADYYLDNHKKKQAESNYTYLKEVENYLIAQAAEMLSVDPKHIDSEVSFLELIDSIKLVKLSKIIENELKIKLYPTILFEYTNIQSLSRYFSENYLSKLQLIFGHKPLDKSVSSIEKTADLNIHKRIKETIENKSNDNIPVAIIGISGIFPKSENVNVFWENIQKKSDLISEIPSTRWDWRTAGEDSDSIKPVKWGGFIDDVDKFDSLFFGISPHEAALMDPQQRIFLQTVWNSIEDAGYRASELSGSKTALFVGASTMDYLEKIKECGVEISGYTAIGNAHSIIANRISYLLNLHGPSEAIDTACSSSLTAIHRGVNAIQTGDCDLAIAGGVNLLITPTLFTAFTKAGMLCEDGRCKTFDASANGYVRGEGAGALLLKPLSKAKADGDQIYAVIRGVALNHVGKSNSLTAPNPNGQSQLLISAYKKAGISPSTVSYIEAHGTGTSLGDPIEVNGLEKAFSALLSKEKNNTQSYPYCGLSSVKTNIGHLEAAAGIAGVIKVLMSMKHKTLPGTVHFDTLNSYIDLEGSPFYIVEKTQEWKQLKDINNNLIPRRAGVSSFGFGGSNAHILLEEYDNNLKDKTESSAKPHIIILSAKNEDRLIAYADSLIEFLTTNQANINNDYLANIAYTLQTGREAMNVRLAVVISDIIELKEKLQHFTENKASVPRLYIGKKNQIKEKLSFLVDDQNGKKLIQSIQEEQNLEKIAQLWVWGGEIQWEKMYKIFKPERISLPTYPFAKISHWIQESNNPDNKTRQISKLHPLIDMNKSTLKEEKFESIFSGNEFFLKDHNVFGQKMLPGVAHIEMARASGEIAAETKITRIRDIVWVQPVVVRTQPCNVEVYLYPSGADLDYEITSGREDESRLLHSKGRLTLTDNVNSEEDNNSRPIDINKIQEQCLKTITGQSYYKAFQKVGLNYGDSFQAIQNIWHNEKEALAKIDLNQKFINEFKGFTLHPSIMDAAFQTVMSLFPKEAGFSSYLPFALGEVTLYKSLEDNCYAYAKLKGNKDNSLVKQFDICITDNDGLVLIGMTDFSLKPFGKKNDSKQKNEITNQYNGIETIVKMIISEKTGHTLTYIDEAIEKQMDFLDMGFDSILQIEVLNKVINAFPELTPLGDELLTLSNFDELIKFISKHVTVDVSEPIISPDSIVEKQVFTLNIEKSNPQNILCRDVKEVDSNPLKLQGELITNEDHPFFFDHPLDHISGLQVIESMKQVCEQGYLYKNKLETDTKIFLSHAKVKFEQFCKKDISSIVTCQEVKNDTGTSFTSEVHQDNTILSSASFDFQRYDKTGISKNNQGNMIEESGVIEAKSCAIEIVNKHNVENVFISDVQKVDDGLGCWLLPLNKNHVFKDNNARKYIDTIHLVEACRQSQRALEFYRRNNNIGVKHLENMDQENLMVILKSIEVNVSKPISQNDIVLIKFGDDKLIKVGNNVVLKGHNIIMSNQVEIGRFDINTMIISNDVYSNWRNDGICSPLQVKS